MAEKISVDCIYLKDAVLNKKKLVVFDTETTGLSNKDEIIQFSAVLVDLEKWEIKEECSFYINIGQPLSPQIIELTHITDETLRTQGISKKEAADKALAFIQDAVLCGHNVTFDINKLQYLFDTVGVEHTVKNHDIVDTLKLCKKFYAKPDVVENHKLSTLINTFKLNDGLSFHNAIDDVIATVRLCKKVYYDKIGMNETEPESHITASVVTNTTNESMQGSEFHERKMLPFIPEAPKQNSGEVPQLMTVSRWKKSLVLDRVYINFIIPSTQTKGQIYYDMHKRQYTDTTGNYVHNINMESLHTQVCDFLWESGISGFDEIAILETPQKK